MKNILYFNYINAIGGVESFFYYLVKKYYNTKDITIYYRNGDSEQIKRLSKYVMCKKYNGETIKCEKAFFNYSLDIIDKVQADEYIQVIHCIYQDHGKAPKIHPKITKYIGVSELACEMFNKATGKAIECVYNPIVINKPKKVLNLISATRLTAEKGKARIAKFAKMLDEAHIPYLWTIFTDDTEKINNPNIIYMEPKLEITDYIANADYLVQLSSTESYCFSVVEALSVSTPVIVTPLPAFEEIGVVDGVNGFIVDFDLKKVPIEKIYKGLQKFKYKPKDDSWDKILVDGTNTYLENLNTIVKVRAIKSYYDMELQKVISPTDDVFEVNKIRAEYLKSCGLIFVLSDYK